MPSRQTARYNAAQFFQGFHMIALPWLYLTLLSIGYVVALIYGQLGVLAAVSIALLLVAGYAVRQQRNPLGTLLGPRLVYRPGPGPGDALAAGFL